MNDEPSEGGMRILYVNHVHDDRMTTDQSKENRIQKFFEAAGGSVAFLYKEDSEAND